MPPDTLFIGRNKVFLPICASTNAAAHQMLVKNEAIEGTIVYTDNQTAGRGQRGNTWESAPHQNLTFSCILQPTFLPLGKQFYLTVCASLAVAATLQPYTEMPIRVKWPNDIYAGDKKLAGILIENTSSGRTVHHSILGIGLNVNQTQFSHPRAISLRNLTGRQHSLLELMDELAAELEKRYLQLRAGNFNLLRTEYLTRLYRYQEWHTYIIDGKPQPGLITGVDEYGRLALQIGQKLVFPDLKEVEYCFE